MSDESSDSDSSDDTIVDVLIMPENDSNPTTSGPTQTTNTLTNTTSAPSVPIYGPHGKLSEYKISNSWKVYENKLRYYFEANYVTRDEQKRAIFLTEVGDDTLAILYSLLTPKEPHEFSYGHLTTVLRQHFEPTPNEATCCYKFYKRDQKVGESISAFAVAVRELSKHCEFIDLDKQLRIRLICGLRDETLKLKLLDMNKKSFAEVLEFVVTYETLKQDVRAMAVDTQTTDAVVASLPAPKPGPNSTGGKTTDKIMANVGDKVSGSMGSKFRCWRCARTNHMPNACFFEKAKCYNCKAVGHISRACQKGRRYGSTATTQLDKTETQKKTGAANHNVKFSRCSNAITEDVEAISDQPDDLFMISSSDEKANCVPVFLNGKLHQMEIDSGSRYTVMSHFSFLNLWPDPADRPLLKLQKLDLRVWNKEQLNLVGVFEVEAELNNIKAPNLSICVMEDGGRTLLGRNWFAPFNIQTPVIVDQLFSDDDEVNEVTTGENIKVKLKGIEEEEISPGFVLCDVNSPAKIGKLFDAQVVILEYKNIICAGFSAVMHIHCAAEEVSIQTLICLIDKKTGEKSKTRPRFIKQDQLAI